MSNTLKLEADSGSSPSMIKPQETEYPSGGVIERDIKSEAEPNSVVTNTEPDPTPAELDKLAVAHQEQFRLLGELAAIDKAIEYETRALNLTLCGDQDLPLRFSYLGSFYNDRFRRLGELEDVEKSIKLFSGALALTPDEHPDILDRHANLAVSYSDRFRRQGEPGDLEKAIEHQVWAVSLTHDNDPDLSSRCTNLGVFHHDRFRQLGEMEDLDKSVECYSRALASTPDGHPDLANRHANLGVSYGDRFRRLGNMKDFEKSLEHRSHALELTPDDHPDLPHRHADLGISYTDRFRRFGDQNDLKKSLEHRLHALKLTPDDHPSMPQQHANLAISYNDRFRRLGKLEDLDKAIEHQSRALVLTPHDHPNLPLWHADLGVSYDDRYKRTGELEDLEISLEHRSRALVLTPDSHPDLPLRHSHLAVSYADRFERLDELRDLETSLEHRLCALTLTPIGHPDLTNRHTELAVSYTARFQRIGELNDLEKSLEHRLKALELTPDGHPDLSRRHGNLGVSYSDRFRHLGEREDLEKSLEHRLGALSLTPDGHPDLSRCHSDLGASYYDQFEHLGNLEDLEKALEHQTCALDLTPDEHPDLSMIHFNLALSHLRHFERINEASHSEASLRSFRRASQLSTGAPGVKFHCALNWAKLASEHGFLNCIEAYQTTIELLHQFIWLGATTNQRYQDLSTTESLAINAAYAAVLHADHKLALEWLEHARCVVWSQSLMLRSPLDQLRASHPALAGRLQTVAAQLHYASTELRTSQTLDSRSDNPEQAGKHRRRLAKEYNGLLSEARMLPGFEDFLRPMKSDGLISAARNGPIVVINCHALRCDALIICPGKDRVTHLPLPDFAEQKAQKARSELESSLRRKGIRQRGIKARLPPGHKDNIASVLLTLWDNIVKPILVVLGFMDNISGDDLPHITWCPTGAMTFLPLHAAGDYEQPLSSVFHYVISSYTPTLTALLTSAPSSLDRASRVLAIGQANTPGHKPLPGTSKELGCVQLHTENKAEYSQLTDNQATTAAVLNAMEQHDWVHLACHAHQNVIDPTKSGFHLHDGTLDLDSINRRSFKNKGLAFLSACQTAMGDERLPDEAIHLASGMLMAGYPSVIATMWSVVDEDAPLVADKVYAQLMKDGKVGNGEAGKALHYAVADLRAKVGEKEFGRWVPYIHIGR